MSLRSYVRQKAARAIATIGFSESGYSDEVTVPMLRVALKARSGSGDDALIQRQALGGLENIGTPEALEVIEEYKKSRYYKQTMGKGLFSAEEIKIAGMRDVLKLWDDSGGYVELHRLTLEALEEIGTPEALAVIAEYKKGPYYEQIKNKDR